MMMSNDDHGIDADSTAAPGTASVEGCCYHIQLCGRIAVLSRGRLAGIVDNGPHAVDQVGSLMIGTTEAA